MTPEEEKKLIAQQEEEKKRQEEQARQEQNQTETTTESQTNDGSSVDSGVTNPQPTAVTPPPTETTEQGTDAGETNTSTETTGETDTTGNAGTNATVAGTTVGTNAGETATVNPEDDIIRQNLVDSYKQQRQTFSDILNAYREDYDRELRESQNTQKAYLRAARWSGATELAASLANMFAVGEGGAVSQVYQPVSQNWMQKAEA